MFAMLERIRLKPKGSITSYTRLVARDIARLRRSLSDGRMFDSKSKTCPLCGSKKLCDKFEKAGFLHTECRDCKFLFVNPRPTSQSLYQYYTSSRASAFFQKQIIEKSKKYRIVQIFKPRACWLHKQFEHPGRILDIGCSTGLLLEEMRSLGWEVFGSEYSYDALKTLRKKGIPHSSASLSDEITFPNKSFNLITLFEVLEHIPDFRATMGQVARILRIGGRGIISVPNISGFEYHCLGNHHTNICPPAHLNYFCPDNIRYLFKKIGLNILKIETPGRLDLSNTLSALLEKRIKTTGHPALDQILRAISGKPELQDLLQSALAQNMCSGHLRVIFSKTRDVKNKVNYNQKT